jgi:two-component system, OmpR family, response regulator VicR
MKNARILYVEDDLTLSFVTRDNLERAGYIIDFCDDGNTAFDKIANEKYDLFILDVMLPKIDGYTLARKIREKDDSVPILFLSAKSTKDDKIYGLQLGADDYITKPFSIEELILKIEIFLKRNRIDTGRTQKELVIQLGSFSFSPARQQLIQGNTVQALTHRESELLACLCKYKDSIAKRDDILMEVWGNDHFFASRSLDVFISRLRKMLRADASIKIENIHNIGYRLITV